MTSRESPGELTLTATSFQIGISVLIGVLFVGIGIGFATGWLDHAGPGEADGEASPITGAVIAIFGAAVVGSFLPRLVSPRPTIVADAAGLHDRSRLGSLGSFAWETIAAVGAVHHGKHSSALGLWLRDPAAYAARRAWIVRPILKLRAKLGRSTARIGVMTTRGAIDDFAKSVSERFAVEYRPRRGLFS